MDRALNLVSLKSASAYKLRTHLHRNLPTFVTYKVVCRSIAKRESAGSATQQKHGARILVYGVSPASRFAILRHPLIAASLHLHANG